MAENSKEGSLRDGGESLLGKRAIGAREEQEKVDH